MTEEFSSLTMYRYLPSSDYPSSLDHHAVSILLNFKLVFCSFFLLLIHRMFSVSWIVETDCRRGVGRRERQRERLREWAKGELNFPVHLEARAVRNRFNPGARERKKKWDREKRDGKLCLGYSRENVILAAGERCKDGEKAKRTTPV